MSTSAVQLFCALLAVAVLAFTVALAGWRVVARHSPGAAGALDALRPAAAGLAAAIAVGCTLGSLYFSEVAHYTPCTMCWYQRIAMYPLSIVLVIAAIRRDRGVLAYVAVLASIGAVVSTYHYLLERFPSLETGACSSAVPCDYIWFEELGFVTLPFMAGCGFLAIVNLVTVARYGD
ncbi:MAG: disulfide bond formation protein B [Ilumatobacteraceae bacterium]